MLSRLNTPVLKPLLLSFLLLLTPACSQLSRQELTTQATQGSTVEVDQRTTQDSNKSRGAAVTSDKVDTVITENIEGVPIYWFIIGGILFGLIIPQPRIIRWLF